MQWYLLASKDFGWTFEQIDETDLAMFFSVIALEDKFGHPDDYVPAERLFGH